MKGMSTTLVIIVAAVVILVTALVILTIFGAGITPVGTLAEARAQCTLQGQGICESTGSVPPTWSINTFRLNNEPNSCESVCGPARDVCRRRTATDGSSDVISYTFMCTR